MEVAIIGAGGLARELSSWASVASSNLVIKGFYADNEDAFEKYQGAGRILGKMEEFTKENKVLIGIANCDAKVRIDELTQRSNVEVASYLDVRASIGLRTSIGEGFVVFPNAVLSCDCLVGKYVFINCGSQIGHDVQIGNYTSIMANVDIGGAAIIGDNVFIGSGVTILPGVKIPANTRIGAGSVILKSIKKEGSYFGNPAKKIF